MYIIIQVVLHPHLKLQYFIEPAGWEGERIEDAEQIVRNEFRWIFGVS